MRCSMSLLLFLCLLLVPVHAVMIRVCDEGCDFSEIQPAIDAASAGDTIEIVGDYSARIEISKPIRLTGNASISHGFGPAIKVRSSSVHIKGLRFRGGVTGIEIAGAVGVRIENCRFEQNYRGIEILDSSGCVIASNEFEWINDAAIRLERSDSNTLSGNKISNSTHGIVIAKSANNAILDSRIEGYIRGIALEYSIGNRIQDNVFHNTLGDTIPTEPVAIYLFESAENEVIQNSAESGVLHELKRSNMNLVQGSISGGVYARDMDGTRNAFLFTRMNVSGVNIVITIENISPPDHFEFLSEPVNVTIIPDIFTGQGYLYIETGLQEDEAGALNERFLRESIAFYMAEDRFNRVSEGLNETNSIAFRTERSGVYVLAGERGGAMTIGLPAHIMIMAVIAMLCAIAAAVYLWRREAG